MPQSLGNELCKALLILYMWVTIDNATSKRVQEEAKVRNESRKPNVHGRAQLNLTQNADRVQKY